jgi:hypothetical protein
MQTSNQGTGFKTESHFFHNFENIIVEFVPVYLLLWFFRMARRLRYFYFVL